MQHRIFSFILLAAKYVFLVGISIPFILVPAYGAKTQQVAPNESTVLLALSSLGNPNALSLPHPLSLNTAKTVKLIFKFQQQGKFDTADPLISELGDNTLIAEILADRYLSPYYHPTTDQLQNWLRQYPDRINAQAIHDLLVKIAPSKTIVPPVKQVQALAIDTTLPRSPEESDTLSQSFRRNPVLDKTVYAKARQGTKGARAALQLIADTPGVNKSYSIQLQTETAQILLSCNEPANAFDIAQQAFLSSDSHNGEAAFTAGLAAWTMKNYKKALPLFQSAAYSQQSSASTKAAGAFWAAKVCLSLSEDKAQNIYWTWLKRASAERCTFYGILSQRLLQDLPTQSIQKSNDAPAFLYPWRPQLVLAPGMIDIKAILAKPNENRFFALLQVGKLDYAEAEIRQLWPTIKSDATTIRSVQLVAQSAGLTSLSTQLDTILDAQNDDNHQNDTRFPTPALKPKNGFKLSPALVYALTRLESNFNSSAISQVGARGLLQIMPAAAQTVMHHSVPNEQLANPSINLEIGQLYLMYLANLFKDDHNGTAPYIEGGDMIRVLAGYNAGPNTITRLDDKLGNITDPLLFIESLPPGETRNYVHRALTYLWIYEMKMDIDSPSLNALAEAKWPSFTDEIAQAPLPSNKDVALNTKKIS